MWLPEYSENDGNLDMSSFDVFDPNTGELRDFPTTSDSTTRAEDDGREPIITNHEDLIVEEEMTEEMAQWVFVDDDTIVNNDGVDEFTDSFYEYLKSWQA
uniref:Uncharacterized protein n=1 Tax=Panagrolaimus sp. JU765 TaxID=591449 RepID=A0AC34RMP6_9BILA